VSGFRVTWDSSRPKGQRVVSICLALDQNDNDRDGGPKQEPAGLDGASVERQRGGRMYKVVTREYMAEGHDGYGALKGCKYLIDDENGKLMSTLVRQYLLGEWKLAIMLSPPEI
jgi:5'-nucleotidase